MQRPPLPPAETVRITHVAEIARGGMGSVYLAHATFGKLDGRTLAVKRLHPSFANDAQFVAMLLDEAWMTAALSSPHIVRIQAWGSDEHGVFLASDLIYGASLAQLIKQSRGQEAFAERTVAFIGSQICAALSVAHHVTAPSGEPLGLVHRDLTPGNVIVGFDGVVRVIDFGIAKAAERLTRTRTGTMKGKPAYIAPEQARGGSVDARTDLFSLGVVLYEMLTGERPWAGQSAVETIVGIATKNYPSVRSRRPACNPLFVRIIDKCLQKNPDRRFQSADEIKELLDDWRAQKKFVEDDTESLRAFVERNARQQIDWFARAERGEFTRARKDFVSAPVQSAAADPSPLNEVSLTPSAPWLRRESEPPTTFSKLPRPPRVRPPDTLTTHHPAGLTPISTESSVPRSLGPRAARHRLGISIALLVCLSLVIGWVILKMAD